MTYACTFSPLVQLAAYLALMLLGALAGYGAARHRVADAYRDGRAHEAAVHARRARMRREMDHFLGPPVEDGGEGNP